jgi:hypothetical protein
MALIPLKDFLRIWHFKLIGLIGPRALSERAKGRIPKAKSLAEKEMWLRQNWHVDSFSVEAKGHRCIPVLEVWDQVFTGQPAARWIKNQ